MADDDDVMDEPEDVAEDEEFEAELDDADIDPEELDEESLEEEDDEFVAIDEDEFGGDEEIEDEDEDEAAEAPPVRRTAAASEDEDEDEDLLAPDDVEADLDTILKDRLVSAEEGNEDDEDETELADDPRTDPGDRLQPKRADEQLCSLCFLLVRAKAPNCPMGDDNCPIFS